MSKAHYDVVEALIPAGLPVHRGEFQGEITEDSYPYVVLGGNLGRDYTEAACGDPDTREVRIKITYAGLSFDSVLITMDSVRAVLAGRKLVVPGWASGILRQEELVDIRTDRDVTIPVIDAHPQYAVDEFTLVSAR